MNGSAKIIYRMAFENRNFLDGIREPCEMYYVFGCGDYMILDISSYVVKRR